MATVGSSSRRSTAAVSSAAPISIACRTTINAAKIVTAQRATGRRPVALTPVNDPA